MPIDHVKLFIEKVHNDISLQKQLELIKNDEDIIYKVIELGRGYGYEFNKEELKEVFVEVFMIFLHQVVDRSEDELKSIVRSFFEVNECTNYEAFNRNNSNRILH